MKTVLKSKNAFIFLTFSILSLLYVAPSQAQAIKRDKQSKEKTKTFIRKSNKLNDSNPGKTTFISLDHFWSSTRTDNYSTANFQGKSGALNTKYRFVRTDGHIQKEPSNIEGHAVPLYLYYSNTRKDNFITASPEGIRAAETGGYRKVRIEGYVLKTVKPEYQHLYKPLWLYYHDTRKDNFTIATPEGIKTAEAGGYRKVRIEGYVSITNRNSAPIVDVLVDDSKNNFLVKNPPSSTEEDLNKWNRIVYKMLGLEGFDPVSNFINYPPSEKRIVGIPGTGSNNNWIPLSYKKQVCCGKLENFKTYDGFGDEMDWNFFVLPNDEFSFLITDALPYKKETPLMSSSGWHINEENRDHRPGYEWKKYKLEAEVTPDQSLYDNPFFPKKGSKKVGDPDVVLEGKEVCFYGPWVREWNHHYRPEIHPSEMIWWRLNGGYYMMLIQDDSNRFDSKDDFDLDGLLPSNWKPWAEPPLTAQFKIAFEINPSASDLPYKMDVREVLKRFVVTKEDAGASADSDNGTSHTLVVDNKKLLIANELQENDNDLGVKFVDITKRANGTIQGYLQITTKVGGHDLGGDEGYHLIYVGSNIPVKKSSRRNGID